MRTQGEQGKQLLALTRLSNLSQAPASGLSYECRTEQTLSELAHSLTDCIMVPLMYLHLPSSSSIVLAACGFSPPPPHLASESAEHWAFETSPKYKWRGVRRALSLIYFKEDVENDLSKSYKFQGRCSKTSLQDVKPEVYAFHYLILTWWLCWMENNLYYISEWLPWKILSVLSLLLSWVSWWWAFSWPGNITLSEAGICRPCELHVL